MGSLAQRVVLAVSIACAQASAAQAEEPLPLFPGPWRVAAQIRLHGALDDGVGFLHPALPLHASVILDDASGRFGISLWRPNELWLLQVGALGSDRRGQPRLEPDDLFESGVAELACEELAHPPPCDAPLGTLAIEVAESSARARIEKGVLRVSGKLRLVIFDPSRPALRIRFGATYDGRGEAPPPSGSGGFDLADAR
jgi:hypothetical protein